MQPFGTSTGSAHLVFFALGGTISMTGAGDGGVVARLSGSDLVSGIEGLDALPGVRLEVRDVPAVPSADLSFADINAVVEAAHDAIERGARGVIITQGTDTLEETAFLIDSLWPGDEPIVLTGAMRNPSLPGADGAANLLAAIQVAASGVARDLGALVVFNDEIHAARYVRKTHTTSPAAFASPDLGPIGHLVEGQPHILARLPRRAVIMGLTSDLIAAIRIALYTVALDDDAASLEQLARSQHGLVIAGFGAGHVPAIFAPLLGTLAQEIPVVLTSRAGAGSTLANTYGAVGSERDLLARGVISGGFVHPYKARVLLRLLVAAKASHDQIGRAFAELG